MNVLIIGGTRFIGPYVVRRLLYLGHNVMVFSRNRSLQSLLNKIWHIWGDRDAIHSFRPAFMKWAPDVVLDMCAYTETQAQQTIAALNGICPRIVVVSSMDVYRGWDRFFLKTASSALEPAPFTENAPLRENFYPRRATAKDQSDPDFSYEKILVERTMSHCPGLACTILRLPAVYGPGDYRRRFFDMVKRMDDKRPFIFMEPAQGPWKWTWGYVEDIACAITLAVVDIRAKNQVYNVGEKLTLTQEEWILRVAQVTGWRGRIILLDANQMPEHLKDNVQRDFAQHLTLDTTKIRKHLGFDEQVPFEQGLVETIKWTRALRPNPSDLKAFDYEAEDACVKSACAD
jgi:nucleoside-diphosphate-sugar epimerase